MPEFRSKLGLLSKICFIALIAVLMILWIVLSVQTVKDISDLDAQTKKSSTDQRGPKFVYDKQVFNRMKGMIIFNTLLEEAIVILVIIGVIVSHKYILHTSMILLTIIWFIAHYRISENWWTGSQVMIASHVFHFIVVCFGLIYTYFVKESDNPKENSAKVSNGNTTASTKAA